MDIIRPQSKQPIPPHARKVFKGEMFSVYQWEQELFNGEKATFEKLKRADTVNVIPILPNGDIVLCEQTQPGTAPFIGTFGGRIDEGEDPLTAAKRELMEEAGMAAENFTLWKAFQPIGKIEWAIFTFIAKGCKKIREQNTDAGEKIRVFSVPFSEFLKLSTQTNFRDTEISLSLFRALVHPSEMDRLKKLF